MNNHDEIASFFRLLVVHHMFILPKTPRLDMCGHFKVPLFSQFLPQIGDLAIFEVGIEPSCDETSTTKVPIILEIV